MSVSATYEASMFSARRSYADVFARDFNEVLMICV